MRKLPKAVPPVGAFIVLMAIMAMMFGPFLGNDRIRVANALDAVGEVRTVCGKVEDARHVPSATGEPTFLNLGGRYPNHVFTVVIWGRHRSRFEQPEIFYLKRLICVRGTVEAYNGKAEMEVEAPGLIKVFDPVAWMNPVLGLLLAELLQRSWTGASGTGGDESKTSPSGPQAASGAAGGGKMRRLRLWLWKNRWRWVLPLVGGLLAAAGTWVLWR